MDVSNTRIVLLGKTGAGKSSLANTMFGEMVFNINSSPSIQKSICQTKSKSIKGRSISLVDTPGFFDSSRSEEELKNEIARSITECAPGPHAFLIVLTVEKFTHQEADVIKLIQEYFSLEVFKYAVVVFTRGDQLSEEMRIQQFISQNKLLSELVKKCGGRCHVVDNKYWNNKQQDEYRNNDFQVTELLNTIEKMVMENNGSYYTNEMLQWQRQQEEHARKSSSSGPSSVRKWLIKFVTRPSVRAFVVMAIGVLIIAKTVKFLRESDLAPVKKALYEM